MGSKAASVAESPASESDDVSTKTLVKKIDRRILPLMCIVYGLAHVDKIVMGFTLLFGFRQDLGISPHQYSWCLAIFFLGYLVAAWPASVLLQYFATTRVLAISILAWAILLLGMLGVKNFSQLLVVRLFLGIFEASITPGLITYTSRWYTRNEQVYRTMLWGAMQTGFSIFGTLASYGLLRIDNTSLERWRYPFLLLGILNFFAGLGWLFFMPESPATAAFLDENERKTATDRVAENMMRAEKTPWKAYQIWEGITDIKVWLLFLFTFLSQLAGNALAAFSSPILASFGFDRYQTLLITIPAWVISLVTVISYGYLSQRFHNGRTIIMMAATIVSVIASALEYAHLGPTQKVKWGKAVALWFTGVAAVLWPVALTVVGQNIAGETKKGLTSTLILVAYATSNTIAPFISGSQDAAGFTRLLAVVMSCYACAFASALLLRLYMGWKNSTRDAKYGPADAEVAKAEGIRDGLEDKTDKENKAFRYLL